MASLPKPAGAKRDAESTACAASRMRSFSAYRQGRMHLVSIGGLAANLAFAIL
jgi:hypothetical protein